MYGNNGGGAGPIAREPNLTEQIIGKASLGVDEVKEFMGGILIGARVQTFADAIVRGLEDGNQNAVGNIVAIIPDDIREDVVNRARTRGADLEALDLGGGSPMENAPVNMARQGGSGLDRAIQDAIERKQFGRGGRGGRGGGRGRGGGGAAV